jgi:hypothetical protein
MSAPSSSQGAQSEETDGDAIVVEGEPEGRLAFSAELGQYELKAADAAHRRQVALAKLQHDLAEQRLDNARRRQREMVGFFAVVGIAVVGLVVGFGVAVWSDNGDTRRWAQGLVTLLFGGIVGGLAGYFTGKVGR